MKTPTTDGPVSGTADTLRAVAIAKVFQDASVAADHFEVVADCFEEAGNDDEAAECRRIAAGLREP